VSNETFPHLSSASLLSRGARFYLVAWLFHHYGCPMKGFIDRYFNALTVLFTVVLVGFSSCSLTFSILDPILSKSRWQLYSCKSHLCISYEPWNLSLLLHLISVIGMLLK
jgi:hypothetical protein